MLTPIRQFDWTDIADYDDDGWVIEPYSYSSETPGMPAIATYSVHSGRHKLGYWTADYLEKKLQLFSDEQLKNIMMRRPVIARFVAAVLKERG